MCTFVGSWKKMNKKMFLVKMGSIFVCSILLHLKKLNFFLKISHKQKFLPIKMNNISHQPKYSDYKFIQKIWFKNWEATTEKERSIKHRLTTTLMCLQWTKVKLIIFWDIRFKMRPKKVFVPLHNNKKRKDRAWQQF